MPDMFGNDTPPPLKPEDDPVALTLFEVAAEALALASGRPLSQERTELLHGKSPAVRIIEAPVPDGMVILATEHDLRRASSLILSGRRVPPELAKRIAVLRLDA